jgi:pyridoxine 5-phosphate synthase
MAVTDEMAGIALKVRPDQVTLVPERPRELTTEGGLDVVENPEAVKRFTARMREAGIAVSIFLDAELSQVQAAKASGAGAIEINTGRYAEAQGAAVKIELDRIAAAARAGADAGLDVLAGHGLDHLNVTAIVGIPEIVELNIGHSIVARAALVGMETAVRDMVALLRR